MRYHDGHLEICRDAGEMDRSQHHRRAAYINYCMRKYAPRSRFIGTDDEVSSYEIRRAGKS